uniref:ELWxxDGT repeat protein n=1 Tax=Flavobacterium sp. TaxID=239 RepID=UPI002FDAB7AB
MKKHYLIICLLICSFLAMAQPGSLDLSFTLASSLPNSGKVFSMALQPDGKIIVPYRRIVSQGVFIDKVVRVNADGTVDPSFDSGTGLDGRVNTIVLQPDGKMLIGGDFTTYNGVSRNRISRLNSDGSLDMLFNPGVGANSEVNTISLITNGLNNGRILIGGSFTSYDGVSSNRIARLRADGTLDTSFNPGDGADGRVESIVLQPDGKILVGGYFTTFDGENSKKIARLNSNGSFDASFNIGNGVDNGGVETIALQPDGKILIGGGFGTVNEVFKKKIARLNSNGSLDEDFNSLELATTAVGDYVYSIVLQPDGKILVGGDFNCIFYIDPYPSIMIRSDFLRLNQDGTYDFDFNSIGQGALSTVRSIAVQPNNKILIGGDLWIYNSNTIDFIARINGGESIKTQIDPSFCGQSLQGLNSIVFAQNPSESELEGASITSYSFKITNLSTNEEQVLVKNSTTFQLTETSFATYNTSYSIEVALQIDGGWHPYGLPCVVTTPNSLTPEIQTPYLVKDIYASSQPNVSSDPKEMIDINGTLFFSAITENEGRELWKSNGALETTVLVKDIIVGNGSSSPEDFFEYNGLLYFSAIDGSNGRELWRSDGTTAGTYMVKDVNGGVGGSFPSNYTILNGLLYFQAGSNFANGVIELWRTDGTATGTVLIKDIYAGLGSSTPLFLTTVNDAFYFNANNGTNGRELWKSDGTLGGTVLLKDIAVGSGSSHPSYLTKVGNQLFFVAQTSENGEELWVSDGTEVGTHLVKDIVVGTIGSFPRELYSYNGLLYFAATDGTNGVELWKSDGTEEGTVMVTNLFPTSGSSFPQQLIEMNGELYFAAEPSSLAGRKLFKTNGTETGTQLVTTTLVGTNSNVANLTNVNGVLYFTANVGNTGSELWRSDGTVQGTLLVKDINEGSVGSIPEQLTAVDGRLYFTVQNYEQNDVAIGKELWSLGNCRETNKIVIDNGLSNAFMSEIQIYPSTQVCHCDVNLNLLASVTSAGESPVQGNVAVKQWIANEQPVDYVKKNYEIYPDNNPTTATGLLTLYFSQADFDTFNAQTPAPINQLPSNPTDLTGKANLSIAFKSGQSSDNTGLPISYSGSQIMINPDDNLINWNSTLNRWEVSFETTGFGGYRITVAECIAPQIVTVPVSQTVCLNSTASFSIEVEGDDLTYQWYKDDVAILDETASSYTIAETTSSDTGNYYVEVTNSCNMLTSELVTLSLENQITYFADADGDGFGDANATLQSCTLVEGYVTNNTDCDDTNEMIYPGATEICWNGVLEDCNGVLSEGCAPIVVNMATANNSI